MKLEYPNLKPPDPNDWVAVTKNIAVVNTVMGKVGSGVWLGVCWRSGMDTVKYLNSVWWSYPLFELSVYEKCGGMCQEKQKL